MIRLLIGLAVLVATLDIATNAILFWSEFQVTSTIPFATPVDCLSNYWSCFTNWNVYSLEMISLLILRLVLNLLTMTFAVRLGAFAPTASTTTTTTTTNTTTTNQNKIALVAMSNVATRTARPIKSLIILGQRLSWKRQYCKRRSEI
jgi:hypothetical protein